MVISFLAIILVIVLEIVNSMQENKNCLIIVVSSVENMAIRLYLADMTRLIQQKEQAHC